MNGLVQRSLVHKTAAGIQQVARIDYIWDMYMPQI